MAQSFDPKQSILALMSVGSLPMNVQVGGQTLLSQMSNGQVSATTPDSALSAQTGTAG